jgi:hypothetical protein
MSATRACTSYRGADVDRQCEFAIAAKPPRSDTSTNEIFANGVSLKVGGWIESALDLAYVIVLVPGEHDRGAQKVEPSSSPAAT